MRINLKSIYRTILFALRRKPSSAQAPARIRSAADPAEEPFPMALAVLIAPSVAVELNVMVVPVARSAATAAETVMLLGRNDR